MKTETIKENLSQAIYDYSCIIHEKNTDNLRAYIKRYLKLFFELSQDEQADFLEGRKDFLIKNKFLKDEVLKK